ncbi:hypothetical protein BVX94_01745 [bacterium B17]|nr:hypothetical protein BVX94_01745 [bacterium B17]
MSRLTEKELKRYAVVSAIVGFVGFVMLMIGRTIHNDAGFWTPYTAAFKGISQLIILIAVMWFGMSMAHLHTSYFDAKEPLSVDKFILYVSLIVMIMFIVGYYAIASLPATPPEKLPQNDKAREQILSKERKDRLYTVVIIMAFGGSFAAFPCLRCFGPSLFPEKKETSEKAS